MDIDVVIVTHLSASHLPRALSALPDEVNVFVVDNASADASADIAESYGATVVRGQVNAGFATGCNHGAALGTASKILFLNPDAIIEREALMLLVEEMDSDDRVGVASPRLTHSDGSRQRVQWPYPTAAGAWREALRLEPKVEESAHGFVIGACFLVRRAAFETVGGFDERFWLYGEEADLCKRIEGAGWLVRRFPSSTATHIGGASGGSGHDDEVFEHFMRGGEHFVSKHAGPGALVSYRAANLVGSVGRGLLGLGEHSAAHRARAGRLVRTVAGDLTGVDLDSPATRAPGKSLVVCSHEAWTQVWRRNRFFIRELLAADPDLRVLFVSRPFDVLHERRRRSGHRHDPGLRPVDDSGRVVLMEPVKWLPRKVGPFADRWRDDQVLDAVRRLGFVDPTLWVNDPSYATLAERVEWPTVYDITDDWALTGEDSERTVVRHNEDRLFARADAVTVCSPGLLASKRRFRDDLVLIPNGVDTDELRRPRPRPADLPDGDTAVYVGTLHTDRIDVDLTARLARELDGVSVVLVGPDSLDDASRRALDAAGVIRLGPRPYSSVPGYMQHASVLIVPHVVSPFTESLDPIKAYESLAVGTPTVATPVAGFRDLDVPIHLADETEYVGVVRALLADRPENTPRRVSSWNDRARAFGEILVRARISATRAFPVATPDSAPGRPRWSGATAKRPRAAHLVVNARYRQRSVTGVERYASELDARLPRGIRRLEPDRRLARPPLGHIWEQSALPLAIGRDEVLWSPCNTGPIFLGRQIVTIHDISPTEHPEWFSPRYADWLDLMARVFVERARHVITVSEFTRQRLCARLGADPERISVVPNGINPTFFTGANRLSHTERERLGIDQRPYLLSLATFEPRKNLHALLAAFQQVRRSFPDLTLVIAGNAGRREIFAANGRPDPDCWTSVSCVGYVPEDLLPALYNDAEALVYVPHYEGFGFPPLEAAAAGTPAVLSDIPALRELGVPATWVDPNDIEAIAAGVIERLSSGPVDSDELRRRASTFTWERSYERFLVSLAAVGVTIGAP